MPGVPGVREWVEAVRRDARGDAKVLAVASVVAELMVTLRPRPWLAPLRVGVPGAIAEAVEPRAVMVGSPPVSSPPLRRPGDRGRVEERGLSRGGERRCGGGGTSAWLKLRPAVGSVGRASVAPPGW